MLRDDRRGSTIAAPCGATAVFVRTFARGEIADERVCPDGEPVATGRTGAFDALAVEVPLVDAVASAAGIHDHFGLAGRAVEVLENDPRGAVREQIHCNAVQLAPGLGLSLHRSANPECEDSRRRQ